MSADAGCAAEAAQLFAAHVQDGLLGTLAVQNTILLTILFVLSALLAHAFRRCRSIHRNSRIILFNLPLGAMLYAVSEFTKMVYYQVIIRSATSEQAMCAQIEGISRSCHWIQAPMRMSLALSFTVPIVLFIEKCIATTLFRTYEKSQKLKVVGPALSLAQIAITCLRLPLLSWPWTPMDVNTISYCTEPLMPGKPYVLSFSLSGICFLMTFAFFVIITINGRKFAAINNASSSVVGSRHVTSRYQLYENRRTGRYAVCITLTMAITVLYSTYVMWQERLEGSQADETLSPEDSWSSHRRKIVSEVPTNVAPLILITIVAMIFHRSVRRRALTALRLNKVACIKRLCMTQPRRQYAVNDLQTVSTSNQQSHFQALEKQWETIPSTSSNPV